MDKELIESAAKGFGFTVFGGEMVSLFWDLRWLVGFVIVLIVVDCWMGLSDSRMNGVPIRPSRAGRRTMNKFVDYSCYLMLGGFLGKAIGEPLGVSPVVVAALAMLFACGFELDSIIGHWCSLHGVPKVSVWKILFSIVKSKHRDIGEAIEDSTKKKGEEQK